MQASPRVPVVAYAAALAAALPLLALIWRRPPWRSVRWIAAACVISLGGDALALVLLRRGLNNHWLAFLVSPLLFAAILLALADRQRRTMEILTLRIAAGLQVLVSLVLAGLADDLNNFSQFAIPLGSLLVFGAAVWTLVTGGFVHSGRIGIPTHWIWVPLGFALYASVTAAYLPLVAVFAAQDAALVAAVLWLKAVVVLVAFGLVAWGVLCLTPAPRSGRSSSSSS